ncbi:MAG: hypothetical protein ACO1SV_26020 [Fimbriimonas sp.]
MKLSPLTIYIIGAALAVVIATYGFFQHWLPNKAEEEMYKANLVLLQDEAAKQGAADKRVNDAIKLVKDADRSWSTVVQTRTLKPSLQQGGIDLTVNRWQLSVDARKFRNNVQRQVNRQLRNGGVEVLVGPYVPGIGENDSVNEILTNYFGVAAYNYPVVIYDLGQVTVRGNFQQITNHVRSWARMPRFLAVADGLAISGTSPNLTGTYNLQVVGFIQGKSVAPPVPEGQAAGGAAGGGFPGGAGGRGGFPGGGSGSFPGAPGSFPGGPSSGPSGMPGRPGVGR